MSNILFKIAAILSSFLVINRILAFSIDIGNYYYIIFAFIGAFVFLSNFNIKPNSYMLLFAVACFVSIIFNDIPSFFQPKLRFIAFLVLISLIGPLFISNGLNRYRTMLFTFLNFFIVVLVTISFFGIVLDLPIMRDRGIYTGLFNHSMMLGPMSVISMLYSIYQAYLRKKIINRWLFIFLSIIAFITALAAGSRAALIAGIIGCLFFYYKKNQGSFTRFSRSVFIIILIGTLSYPFWNTYTQEVTSKMDYAYQQEDLFVTRASLWEARVTEFRTSPIIGVGFSSVKTSIIGNKFNTDEGYVEPGSSWLAILSMTGIIGFIPLFLLVSKYMWFLFKERKRSVHFAYLGGLLLMFLVHMGAEGYVLSAGSGLFFYFWLSMGVIGVEKNKFKK